MEAECINNGGGPGPGGDVGDEYRAEGQCATGEECSGCAVWQVVLKRGEIYIRIYIYEQNSKRTFPQWK